MGVILNGAAGVNSDAEFGITGDDGTIPGQEGLTQPVVIDILKQTHVLDNTGFATILSQIFDGLREGVSLALAVIEKIVNTLLGGATTLYMSVTSALADLATVITSFINQALTQIVTLLVTALDSVPFIGPPIGNAVSDLAALFGLMNDRDSDAQSSADTANIHAASLDAQLQAFVSGGDGISDNFDRTGSDLGSDWTWFYSGAGSGGAKTNGNDAYWDVAGASGRIIRAHHNTALASNRQQCSLVQTAPQNASNTDPELRLLLRSDAAVDNYLMANWTHAAAAIGYVVGGSYTQLGASVAHSAKTGAAWAFWAGIDDGGDPDEDYVFRLYLNGALLLERVDTSHASVIGASNLYAGMGMLAGVTFDAFGFHQKAPPKIQGWAEADR